MMQRFDDGDVQRAVNAAAPRLFAVVVYRHPDSVADPGTKRGDRIVAWGLDFPDGADIVASGGLRMSVQNPERALDVFVRSGADADLYWVGTPACNDSEKADGSSADNGGSGACCRSID